jgi:hypothetical protein
MPYRPETQISRQPAQNLLAAKPGMVQAKRFASSPVETRPAPRPYSAQARAIGLKPKAIQSHTVAHKNGVPALSSNAPRPLVPADSLSAAKGAAPGAKPVSLPRPMIQRYTHYTGPEFGGNGTLSENENYFIPDADNTVIYGTSAPSASTAKASTATVSKSSKTYTAYVSVPFFKDCLHTAEEIINGAQLQTMSGRPATGVFSQISSTGTAFGDTEAGNIKAAQAAKLDDAAAPGVGEAYVIVNTKWLDPSNAVRYPYHAAAVVAVDGSDRITVEVSAGARNAAHRNQAGQYQMYTTGSGSGVTFHTHWQKACFGKDSITTVIKKK